MELSFLKDLYIQMMRNLKQIRQAKTDSEKWAMESIPVVQKGLVELKAHIIAHPFKRRSEEILFFKYIKPAFASQLIFFVEVFNMWRDSPALRDYNTEKEYWFQQMKRIDHFFQEDEAFCRYMAQDNPWLDAQFFVRHPKNAFFYFGLPKKLDPVTFYGDPDFSTSHDYRSAKMMAYFRLQKYIRRQLVATEKIKHLPPEIREDHGKDAFHLFVSKSLSDFRKTKAGKMSGTDEALEYLDESIQTELSQPSGSSGSDPNKSLRAAIEKFRAQVAAENKDIKYDIDNKSNSEEQPTT